MSRIMEDSGPVLVEFHLEAIEDRAASQKAGHYVARDVEFISITPPGGNMRWEGRCTDVHRQRYERQYKAWKEGLEPPVDGTPLKEWPPITPAQIRTLSAVHVRTVEGLAACPDQALNRAGIGFLTLKHKAAAYLRSAADHGQTAEEISALKVELESVRDRMEQLVEENARLKADKPKRGRPRKDRSAA